VCVCVGGVSLQRTYFEARAYMQGLGAISHRLQRLVEKLVKWRKDYDFGEIQKNPATPIWCFKIWLLNFSRFD